MTSSDQPPATIRRRELFERLWSKPMTTNALELGTTTSILSALARRLGLPVPRPGHWMKAKVGKAPDTPNYSEDASLEQAVYAVPGRRIEPFSERLARPRVSTSAIEVGAGDPAPEVLLLPDADADSHIVAATGEHPKVASTRKALGRTRDGARVTIGGRGKFRLLVSPASGERACGILDQLLASTDLMAWPLESTEQGYAIVADGERVGFVIEKLLDAVPHMVTAAEQREKVDYDRKCALADRGIGYRPWREPAVPTHDHVPNGSLVFKLDRDYAASGVRRTFSDGKRQRLDTLVPSIVSALERWAAAVKARREERARWEQDWAEEERQRKDRERQVRVEGYRIAFLQRQIERKREIDGLQGLIGSWEQADRADAGEGFEQLLEFARLYRSWLEAKLAPVAVSARIAELKLMDDNVYIYDPKRLE